MKALLLIASLLFTSLSFAGVTHVCVELTPKDPYIIHKMVLAQVGHDKIEEGKFIPFVLQIFQGSTLLIETPVNVRTEDVMFNFTNTAKKVKGIIFLDEMDDSWVKIGKLEFDFNCN